MRIKQELSRRRELRSKLSRLFVFGQIRSYLSKFKSDNLDERYPNSDPVRNWTFFIQIGILKKH
jgi:hypothetical protein